MIQHPKDAGRPDSAVPGANGTMSSPRPTQGVPVHGLRAASPPCLIQRQVQREIQTLMKSKQLQTVNLSQL